MDLPGFFNIDSDMLLLECYFLFAADFCRYISDMAELEEEVAQEIQKIVDTALRPKGSSEGNGQ